MSADGVRIHPLMAPLAAYRTACDHPDVLDVTTAANILADNVQRFIDAQADPSAEHDRERDERATRRWIAKQNPSGHDCGSCGTSSAVCLARLVEHGPCCARCGNTDTHGSFPWGAGR